MSAAKAAAHLTEDQSVRAWTPLAYSIADKFFLPGADREDLRQEALLALVVGLRSYRDGAGHVDNLKAFLGMVIRRRLCSELEQANRVKRGPLNDAVRYGLNEDGHEMPILDLLPGGEDPYTTVAKREHWLRLCDAAATFTDVQRQAVEWAIAGEPYSDSKRLDNALQRARRKLRKAA